MNSVCYLFFDVNNRWWMTPHLLPLTLAFKVTNPLLENHDFDQHALRAPPP